MKVEVVVKRRMSVSMSVSVRARQRPCGAQRGGRRAHPDARRRDAPSRWLLRISVLAEAISIVSLDEEKISRLT